MTKEGKNTLKELRVKSMVVSANDFCAFTDNLKIFIEFGTLGLLEYHRSQSAAFHDGALRNIHRIETWRNSVVCECKQRHCKTGVFQNVRSVGTPELCV